MMYSKIRLGGVAPHHLGIVVADLMKSIQGYRGFGWKWNGEIIEDKERSVKLAFLNRDGSDELIELVCPMTDKSPVSNTLLTMKNVATPYHICYAVKDIEKVISILKGRNYTLTSALKPAVAFSNRRVAFMLNRDAGLIELLEEENIE